MIPKEHALEFVFLTGLSGAGKSTALKSFEDLGFFCIDNLPPKLLPTFVELCHQSVEEVQKVAIGIDIREREFLKDFPDIYSKLKIMPYKFTLLFFDAADESLIRRFVETRRPHPLAFDKPVDQGLQEERNILIPIKNMADKIIDTSNFTVHDLRKFIIELYPEISYKQEMLIYIVSFGYKFGIPFNADLVFDVRFLPNPYFISELKNLPGNNEKVKQFILSSTVTTDFIKNLTDFINYLIPHYQSEGKKYLTIAIGCTGGKHRSVCIAHQLHNKITEQKYSAKLQHRDIEK